jgi:hypothetical protein
MIWKKIMDKSMKCPECGKKMPEGKSECPHCMVYLPWLNEQPEEVKFARRQKIRIKRRWEIIRALLGYATFAFVIYAFYVSESDTDNFLLNLMLIILLMWLLGWIIVQLWVGSEVTQKLPREERIKWRVNNICSPLGLGVVVGIGCLALWIRDLLRPLSGVVQAIIVIGSMAVCWVGLKFFGGELGWMRLTAWWYQFKQGLIELLIRLEKDAERPDKGRPPGNLHQARKELPDQEASHSSAEYRRQERQAERLMKEMDAEMEALMEAEKDEKQELKKQP